MILSYFDHFISPELLGISLILIALAAPLIFQIKPCPRWANNRLLTLQNWILGQFARQILIPLGLPGHKWALLFGSLLIYLMTVNLMGLLPYSYTPTTQLSVNLGLAVPLWLATVIVGFRNKPDHALAHLLPEGTPTFLIPVLIIIETISLFIRPLALAVRLTANLTAGHLLILLISQAIYSLITWLPWVAAIASALLFTLTLLEFAVAVIQAYVFVLLLSLYLQENI